jgi:hypothetical protein
MDKLERTILGLVDLGPLSHSQALDCILYLRQQCIVYEETLHFNSYVSFSLPSLLARHRLPCQLTVFLAPLLRPIPSLTRSHRYQIPQIPQNSYHLDPSDLCQSVLETLRQRRRAPSGSHPARGGRVQGESGDGCGGDAGTHASLLFVEPAEGAAESEHERTRFGADLLASLRSVTVLAMRERADLAFRNGSARRFDDLTLSRRLKARCEEKRNDMFIERETVDQRLSGKPKQGRSRKEEEKKTERRKPFADRIFTFFLPPLPLFLSDPTCWNSQHLSGQYTLMFLISRNNGLLSVTSCSVWILF